MEKGCACRPSQEATDSLPGRLQQQLLRARKQATAAAQHRQQQQPKAAVQLKAAAGASLAAEADAGAAVGRTAWHPVVVPGRLMTSPAAVAAAGAAAFVGLPITCQRSIDSTAAAAA